LLLPILSSISQVPEYKRQAYFDAPSPAHGWRHYQRGRQSQLNIYRI
jgi:hypothetical protein